MGQKSKALALKNLLFALLACVLAFLLLEGTLSVLGDPPDVSRDVGGAADLPEHYLTDDEIGWRHRPGARLFDPTYQEWAERWGQENESNEDPVINQLGFRDSELASSSVDGQIRVLCAGDSSVLGVGTAAKWTYSERLERALNGGVSIPERRKFEVMNGGVSGYSTFQSLVQIERQIDLGLDAVIFYNMNSDLMTANGSPDVVFFRSWSRDIEGSTLGSIAVYRWMKYGLSRLKHRGRKVGEPALRVRLEDYRKNLERAVYLSENQDFKLIFVVAPAVTDLIQEEPFEAYQIRDNDKAEAVLKILEDAEIAKEWWAQERQHFRMAMAYVAYKHQIPLVDAPSYFHGAVLDKPLDYEAEKHPFADEIHPSANGHRLLAEQILPVLQANLAP